MPNAHICFIDLLIVFIFVVLGIKPSGTVNFGAKGVRAEVPSKLVLTCQPSKTMAPSISIAQGRGRLPTVSQLAWMHWNCSGTSLVTF